MITTIQSVHGPDGNRIAEYNQATGALIRQYVWLNGAPLAVIEGGVIAYVRADHIGRPAFATNSSGTVVWSASYLPFGGVRVSTGTPITARFPGQWFQSENGLHQNWMRDYDPTTGRYLQADPLGLIDGASVYGYALQNPGRFVDPTGEFIPFAVGRWALATGGAALARWALANIAIGFAFDQIWGDGCYRTDELLWDAGIGAAGGLAFKGLGLGWNAWRAGGIGTSAFGGLSRAAEFGILPYSQLRNALKGTGLQAHHLLERRFTQLGLNPRHALSVGVTPGEHQIFTNAWRRFFPYGTRTSTATRTEIMDAAREIYADYPGILNALGL